MKKVVVFGTGGLGQLASVYLSKDSPYEVSAFTAHERYIKDRNLLGLDVVPFENIESSHPPGSHSLFVAVGYVNANTVRAEIYATARRKGYELISYVSSKAIHWGEFDLGDNCFVLEGAVINPFARIGNNVVITPGVLVSHHCSIGDHSFLGPHAVINGYTNIGAYSLVGSNATVTDGITIGARCIISAGSVVNKNTEPDSVWYSEPARKISTNSKELGALVMSPFFRD